MEDELFPGASLQLRISTQSMTVTTYHQLFNPQQYCANASVTCFVLFQVMFFLVTSLVGIILGAFLAALGLVFDQKNQIETGGMVNILSSLHRFKN